MSKAKQIKSVDHLITSDSDDAPVQTKKTQATKPVAKKPLKEESDESSDDSIKFLNTKKAREDSKVVTKTAPKKQAVESDESSEEVKPKNGTKKPVGKKAVESESDSDAPKKTTKAQPAKKAPAKKQDSDDDSDELPKKTQPAKKAPVKKQESDSDSDEVAPKKTAPVKKAPAKKQDSDDEESEEVAPKKTASVKKAPAKKQDSDDDSDEVPAKKTAQPAKKAPVKQDSEEESSEEATPKKTAPVKTQAQSNSDCKELFLKNLSWNTDDNKLYEFFGNYGTVNNVKVLYDKTTGRARGLGFVEFSTRDEAQAAIDDAANLTVDGRLLQVTYSDQKDAGRSPQNGNRGTFTPSTYTPSNYDGEKHTIFVGNLGFKSTEQSVKNFFKDCGNVVDVRIAKDRDTGKSKGFCHVDFDNASAVEKSIAKAGQQLDGREVRVDASVPRSGGSGGAGGRKYYFNV
jgi:nucleolin